MSLFEYNIKLLYTPSWYTNWPSANSKVRQKWATCDYAFDVLHISLPVMGFKKQAISWKTFKDRETPNIFANSAESAH